MVYGSIPEAWMDEHICHHGDTLRHKDVVGCHREASYAACKHFINRKDEGKFKLDIFLVLV